MKILQKNTARLVGASVKSNHLRRAGILLHISSLPSGRFGKCAYEFAEFLRDAAQTVWQILPLNPVDEVGSPYNSPCTFAIEPQFIDVTAFESGFADTGTDLSNSFYCIDEFLYNTYLRCEPKLRVQMDAFASENAFWIQDYCLFAALKEHFSGAQWNTWPEGIRLRHPDEIKRMEAQLRDRIDYHLFLQYLADKQWHEIRSFANSLGILIMGDMPFYTAFDSADVWSHREVFMLDEDTCLSSLSGGVPPDYFSETGQMWNTPVYNWDEEKSTGFMWWKARVGRLSQLYDIIRIDHFRAIESFYAIDANALDASEGRWIKGPGMELIRALENACRNTNTRFVAEDLGIITPEVRELLTQTGYPGMGVLQFGFDGNPDNSNLPFLNNENRVFYTGTHDNTTLKAWIESLDSDEYSRVKDYFALNDDRDIELNIIAKAMACDAEVFIAQMQDYLGMGDEGRMNAPGTTVGNWRFRLKAIPCKMAKRIREITSHNMRNI